MTPADDPPTPDEQRARERALWERQAAQWETHRAWFQEAVAPVSHAMIEAIAPQPGHVVLEAAAGLGDTGLLVAEMVHPGGKVIISDGAPAMVEAAKRHAQERDIVNVEVTAMELEWLDMAAASVDGLLVRFGYMLVPDPESALRDARRVLRPGGRIALAVWDAVERNPWLNVGRQVLVERYGAAPWPPPGSTPSPFALADAARLEELLGTAGFVLPAIQRVPVRFCSPTPAVARERFLAFSDTAQDLLGELAPSEREAAEQRIEAAFAAYPDLAVGGEAVAVPGVALVVSADA